MGLRRKLLLAQLPLAVALVVVVVLAWLTVESQTASSRDILQDNYRSVLAVQRIVTSAQRMDSAAVLRLVGADARADDLVARHRPVLAAELVQQEQNITEPGEAGSTARLREAWVAYALAYDAFTASPSAARYFDELAPRFTTLDEVAQELLALNHDAMTAKRERARSEAERAERVVAVAAGLALLLGLLGSAWITSRLVRPLRQLSRVARRIGEGELSARAAMSGSDEIAAVARELDEMARKLEVFRASSRSELLQAQLTAQAAIDSIDDPVVVFDRAGAVLAANTGAATVLGLPDTAALAGLDPELARALVHARDHVLEGGAPYLPRGFDEAVALASPGGERWYLPRASPLFGEASAITGVTVVVQDVTRLRRFDELRNNVVGTVAHELRTPLTSLHMAIHLCLENAAGELTAKQRELLVAARDDSTRLQTLVDDLLDLTRLQAGKLELERELVGADSLVEHGLDAHRTAAERRGVVFETHIAHGLAPLSIDRLRVQSVLDNLIANAVRHAPAGTTVTIGVDADPDAERSSVRFTVDDRGPGVPAQYTARVFERFFRVPGTTSPGAGLGLSIAREIVAAHGGEIGVRARSGGGASFWFTLPAPAADQ